MQDPVSMARSARERLAQGLAALQSPGVPSTLLGVAEPVAQAMSALHQIEASGGSARTESAPRALDGVRRALAALQTDTSHHNAVIQATEAVASSLALVHGLMQPAAQPAAASPAFTGAAKAPAAAPRPAAPAGPPPSAPANAFAGTMPAAQSAAQRPVPPPMAQPAAPAPAAAPAAPAPNVAAARGPAPPATGLGRVDAELGVHSATNFYKGLSGNDLIDSGGIFIATYQIPPIGTHLMIHVTMPGGYEFQAKGVVRWTREAPLSARAGVPEAPPGFGAQFTEITPEGRQLIQRYVRNREPLFHDDL